MPSKKKGIAVIIGGHEDKEKDRVILREFVRRVGPHHIVVVTAASEFPKEVAQDYRRIFHALGLKDVSTVTIADREDAMKPTMLKKFSRARGVFFTGGDQVKLAAKLGGTPVLEKILEIYASGGVLGGTSAGASAMSEKMLVESGRGESHKVGDSAFMGPGLGIVKEMIIDQHFAQRGRIWRLLGAVGHNPGLIGIGIDEDSAIVLHDNQFQVVGSGAVYVVDGRAISYTNISEAAADQTMGLFNLKMHVLTNGNGFDLRRHEPAR